MSELNIKDINDNEVDIVIGALQSDLTSFMNEWRPFFAPFHLIIVKDPDLKEELRIPEGFNVDVYSKTDIEKVVGSSKSNLFSGYSCRYFGYLISRKKYILSIDDDCFPAKDSEGVLVNAVAHHISNLARPATPFFFNTLYDPYREGADFVRGYPFSLRSGVNCALSCGLWLNLADFDAPTQALKPEQRNSQYVDAVMTVPARAMLPISGINIAKIAMAHIIAVLLLMDAIVSGFRVGVDGLSMEYYALSCPLAEFVVKNTVNKALQADPTLAAALVRMHFHDCWIEGCDGSILIDSTKDNTAEKDSPGNLSLRGYEIIDDAKEELEMQCPGVVSCADIVAMAARDAIFWTGGPVYDILKGRKDGRRSKIEDTINLPFPTFNASELIRVFGQRGFSAQEMVALSGAHTLGMARCSSFKSRLTATDPNLDSDFAKTLSKTCRGGDNAEQPFDATRNTFDNFYFNALIRKSGVLFSDQTLYTSPKTKGVVNNYALNQAMFFFDFQQAMVKMSTLDVKEGSKGEVRNNCRKVN